MIEIALDAVKKAEKELLNYKDNPIIISEKKRKLILMKLKFSISKDPKVMQVIN